MRFQIEEAAMMAQRRRQEWKRKKIHNICVWCESVASVYIMFKNISKNYKYT